MIFKLELVCRVNPHLPVELAWIVSKTLEKGVTPIASIPAITSDPNFAS